MAVSINTNLNALGAIRRLAEASSRRLESFERLSSGLRINQASDDAAGLSVASTLNVKARVYTQALRNVNDGISYLNVADGATKELKNVLFRLRELSTQSSNGSLSNTQRQSLDKEAQALQGEYNRIIDTTKFNGVSVFGGDALYVQAGFCVEGALGVTLASSSSVTRGDGTFQARLSFASGTNPQSVSLADFNGDGAMDLVSADAGNNTLSVLLGNGDGTFQARRSFASGMQPFSVSLADFNGDGAMDLVSADRTDDTLSVLLGNGDGTFQARQSFASGTNPQSVSLADFNGDGVLDLVSADAGNNTLSVFLGNGDGTFQARRSFASGAYPRSVSLGDFNGDGVLDLVSADRNSNTLSVLLGNGDGTFQARQSFDSGTYPYSVSLADFNGDGVMDIVSADQGSATLSVLLGNGSITTSFEGLSRLSGVSVATQSLALSAQDQIDSYLDNVNTVSSAIGSAMSRFAYAAHLLQSSVAVTKAAESRIKDVDVAKESSRLLSTDILQQAASAVLAHALKGPDLALRLLSPGD